MAATLTEHTQYVDEGGKPLVGGEVFIGVQGADPVTNPQDIFSDRALTTLLANPQALDAQGRTANKIWTDGNYSIRVNDSLGNQIYQELDNGTAIVGGIITLTNISGSDVITATASPTIVGYVENQIYVFKTVGANLTAVTIDVDGNGALALVKGGDAAVPLVPNDLPSGAIAQFSFDGTQLQLLNVQIAGRQTIFLAPGFLRPTLTDGCSGVVQDEFSANNIAASFLSFAPSLEEHAYGWLPTPKGWNGDTLAAKFIWKYDAPNSSDAVVWGIAMRAYGDNVLIGQAPGPEITVTATGALADAWHGSAETAAITPAGTLDKTDWLYIEIARKAADVADTLLVNADLLGVEIYLTTDSNTDN